MTPPERVVIIGGVACGMKTAARLRRRNHAIDITVLEKGEHLSYGACGIPYYLGGIVRTKEGLMSTPLGAVRNSAFFAQVKGVRALIGMEAVGIDRQRQEVTARNSRTGQTETFAYDRLVLATGGEPVMPEIDGAAERQGVFTVTNLDAAISIREYLDQHDVHDVVIAGGGFIGLETAEGLVARGLRVAVVKTSDTLLPAMFDRDMQLLVLQYMQQKGIRMITGDSVVRVERDQAGKLATVVTAAGTRLSAGLLLVTKGLQPNVSLARNAGLEIGAAGGIAVNHYLQTSDPRIYAGGDCVESTHLLSGDKLHAAMGSIANLHGRVIADHIAGDDTSFPGVLGTGIFKLFDYAIAATGLTETHAREQGRDVVSVLVPGPDKPHFYRGARPIIMKLVADRASGRLLGAQMIGSGDVAKRMDILITAISCGGTVDRLATLNLAYSPPYSPPLDNVITAANVLRNKIAGIACSCSPLEVKEKFDRNDDFVYLDVRSAREFAAERIDHPAVMHLPLGSLRSAPPAIDRDRDIVISCKSSLRAYEAQRILQAQGFTRVRFMEGGLMCWPFAVAREATQA